MHASSRAVLFQTVRSAFSETEKSMVPVYINSSNFSIIWAAPTACMSMTFALVSRSPPVNIARKYGLAADRTHRCALISRSGWTTSATSHRHSSVKRRLRFCSNSLLYSVALNCNGGVSFLSVSEKDDGESTSIFRSHNSFNYHRNQWVPFHPSPLRDCLQTRQCIQHRIYRRYTFFVYSTDSLHWGPQKFLNETGDADDNRWSSFTLRSPPPHGTGLIKQRNEFTILIIDRPSAIYNDFPIYLIPVCCVV